MSAHYLHPARRYPLPDALFALHVSDRPKVSLATHRQPDGSVSPARLPVSLGYSKTESERGDEPLLVTVINHVIGSELFA